MGVRLQALGVDSGGTFTDLVSIAGGRVVQAVKVSSTPAAPADAVVSAMTEVEHRGSISRMVHGTTVGTNAVLQRSGARLCLLATAGFEDIPFIQRLNRRYAFRLDWKKPAALVKRRHVIGVRERIDSDAAVVEALTESECRRVALRVHELVERDGIEAVAICLLFSYLNDSHERMLAERLRDELPEIPLSLSSVVSPLWREYERTSTSLADAYVRPLVSSYVRDVREQTRRFGAFPLLMLKSSGGTASPESIVPVPVTTLLSGLAGGVVGGSYFARCVGEPHCITFDMGGTSTDIGLVNKGEIGQLIDYEIEWGLPVATPVVDVHTIGAGGGSVARVDSGGLIRVGPQSAGAYPGPACYGNGYLFPTVTDANLVLGRLSRDYFLGGQISLDAQAAEDALDRVAADMPSGDLRAAALAVIKIANENMANAVRVVTIERGIDPRSFALVAFGGAGPLHACGVADAIGIRRVIVPPYAGFVRLSARRSRRFAPIVPGVLALRSDMASESDLRDCLADAVESMRAELLADGLERDCVIECSLACRYYGQNYEHPIVVGDTKSGLLNRVERSFHDTHERAFGYAFRNEPIEIAYAKVTARELVEPTIAVDDRPNHAGPQMLERRVTEEDGETRLGARDQGRCRIAARGGAADNRHRGHARCMCPPAGAWPRAQAAA